MSDKDFAKLSPTETLELDNGLSLVSRIKLLLTIHPSLPSSTTRPIDDWKLKKALLEYLKTSLSLSLSDDDLAIKRVKDFKSRKIHDPVAHGTLCVRDLKGIEEEKFGEWRERVVGKLDGIELNLEGEKYRLSVSVPESDDFEGLKKSWEEFFAFRNRGHYRGGREEPDTIIIRGVPSRWFAEPRVSSKPSMLVTHTIFSTLGKIRNLDVAEDNDRDKDAVEYATAIISGLHCKIVIQFEKHKDFYNALRVLCGRSLQKQGSPLKADYEVTWGKYDFFRNSRNQTQEKSSRVPALQRLEAPGRESYTSQAISDDRPRKRFKE